MPLFSSESLPGMRTEIICLKRTPERGWYCTNGRACLPLLSGLSMVCEVSRVPGSRLYLNQLPFITGSTTGISGHPVMHPCGQLTPGREQRWEQALPKSPVTIS